MGLEKVYEWIERRGGGVPAPLPDTGLSGGASNRSHDKSGRPGPDQDLLALPLARLTRPLKVWSALLQDVLYLVPDEATASRLLAEGKAAYYPEEVQILLEIRDRWPDTWPVKVQAIHRVKKEFGGLVTELPPDHPEARLG